MIRYTKIDDDAIPPRRAHAGDAAFDVHAIEDVTLTRGARRMVGTGLIVTVTQGYVIQILARSGMAFRHGVIPLNAPGLIDSGYRGELKIILGNMSTAAYRVEKGHRIAQLLVLPYAQFDIEEGEPFPAPDKRGEGGFGSTGR